MSRPTRNKTDDSGSSARFDDRIDTDARIGNWEVLKLLGRSLKLLASAKGLFAGKLALAALALIPSLYASWLPKILVDQVILQQPFDETKVPFPPHIIPFVNAVRDLAPMEIMAALAGFFILLLLLFGREGVLTGFAQGEDSATQSENALSDGNSQANGLVGVGDAFIHIRLSQKLTNHLRTTLFQKMARLPMTTLDDHRIGDAVYRVTQQADGIFVNHHNRTG